MKHAQTWDILEHALDCIDYGRDTQPGWKRFHLERDNESNYAVLFIFTHTPNTYRPAETRHTRHEFVVPVATYHFDAWVRWVFERICQIEMHETCEWFKVCGERVYAPHHGNGWDPYTFWPGHDAAEKLKAPGED